MHNPMEQQNYRQYLMKTNIKQKETQVFGDAHKHVSGIMVLVNRLRTPKLLAIKHKKDELLLVLPKQVNFPGTPKIWAMTHENVYKMQKRRLFVITLKHVNRPRTPK